MQTCSVEINSSFYGTPASSTLASWVRHHFPSARVTLRTAPVCSQRSHAAKNFGFVLKASKAITHEGRLMAGRPLAHFIESANELGDSLSAVLFQVDTLGYSVVLCRRAPSTAGRFRIESKMKV